MTWRFGGTSLYFNDLLQGSFVVGLEGKVLYTCSNVYILVFIFILYIYRIRTHA